MTGFPCLVRWVSRSGEARYRLGHLLVDRYLEFVAGRARPNTLRAVAFDLKTFFTVVAKDPVAVAAADVFEFLQAGLGQALATRVLPPLRRRSGPCPAPYIPARRAEFIACRAAPRSRLRFGGEAAWDHD
jgi:hypothetical protein